jgi:hypothetical protein
MMEEAANNISWRKWIAPLEIVKIIQFTIKLRYTHKCIHKPLDNSLKLSNLLNTYLITPSNTARVAYNIDHVTISVFFKLIN